MKSEDHKLDELVSKLTSKEFELQTELDAASIKLAEKRKELDLLNKAFEEKRNQLDQFQKTLAPKFSIVKYNPGSTEFFRASYRHFDQGLGKSLSRVVHLGPIKDFQDVNDPALFSLAKKQIVSYLMRHYPGLYDGI